jgi:hypothetical protein
MIEGRLCKTKNNYIKGLVKYFFLDYFKKMKL